MKVTAVLLAAVLSHFAAAAPAPQHKRDVAQHTVVIPVVETVVVTTTITLQPGQSPPTPAAKPAEAAAEPSPDADKPKAAKPEAEKPAPAAPQPQKLKAEPAPAPAALPTTAPEPVKKPEPVKPAPQAAAPQPAPQEKVKPAPAPSTGGGGGGGGGGSFPSGSGKATWFEQKGAAGSCGHVHGDSELLVAIAHGTMEPLDGGNPNNNPYCKAKITVTGPTGISATGIVADKCPGCEPDHIDLSDGMFKAIGGGDGVIQGVKWSFS